jgi:hypothetical protein
MAVGLARIWESTAGDEDNTELVRVCRDASNVRVMCHTSDITAVQSSRLSVLCKSDTLIPMLKIPSTVQITVRIPRELGERAEKLVTLLSQPGTETNLTTVIREAVDRGITSLEASVRKKAGK